MDKKQNDEINAARLEVTKAKEGYVASVERYRAAINPTSQEFNDAEASLSMDEDENDSRGRGRSREELITGAMDYEEGILNQILEQRGDNEE